MEDSTAKDAVLGVVSGGQEVVKGEEEEHLMARNTKEFSSSIRGRLKQLGVVKSIGDLNSRSKITRLIDDGITINDLIKRIGGNLKEDVYESEVESMERNADIRNAMALQDPDYVEKRETFVRRLMEKGVGEDEANKRADAIFGPKVKARNYP